LSSTTAESTATAGSNNVIDAATEMEHLPLADAGDRSKTTLAALPLDKLKLQEFCVLEN